MKKLMIFTALFLLIGLSSCEEDSQPLECATDLICTEQLVSFAFQPTNGQGEPLILDNYYTQNLDNGNSYDFNNPSFSNTPGFYIVISDSQMNEIEADGTRIRFIGEVNGEIVVQQDFVVGHDCCHITQVSGPFVQ